MTLIYGNVTGILSNEDRSGAKDFSTYWIASLQFSSQNRLHRTTALGLGCYLRTPTAKR